MFTTKQKLKITKNCIIFLKVVQLAMQILLIIYSAKSKEETHKAISITVDVISFIGNCCFFVFAMSKIKQDYIQIEELVAGVIFGLVYGVYIIICSYQGLEMVRLVITNKKFLQTLEDKMTYFFATIFALVFILFFEFIILLLTVFMKSLLKEIELQELQQQINQQPQAVQQQQDQQPEAVQQQQDQQHQAVQQQDSVQQQQLVQQQVVKQEQSVQQETKPVVDEQQDSLSFIEPSLSEEQEVTQCFNTKGDFLKKIRKYNQSFFEINELNRSLRQRIEISNTSYSHLNSENINPRDNTLDSLVEREVKKAQTMQDGIIFPNKVCANAIEQRNDDMNLSPRVLCEIRENDCNIYENSSLASSDLNQTQQGQNFQNIISLPSQVGAEAAAQKNCDKNISPYVFCRMVDDGRIIYGNPSLATSVESRDQTGQNIPNIISSSQVVAESAAQNNRDSNISPYVFCRMADDGRLVYGNSSLATSDINQTQQRQNIQNIIYFPSQEGAETAAQRNCDKNISPYVFCRTADDGRLVYENSSLATSVESQVQTEQNNQNINPSAHQVDNAATMNISPYAFSKIIQINSNRNENPYLATSVQNIQSEQNIQNAYTLPERELNVITEDTQGEESIQDEENTPLLQAGEKAVTPKKQSSDFNKDVLD